MVKRKTNELCEQCARCCSYFSLEIDAPECREDFENITWMLLHENVSIHVEGNAWQAMVKNKCKFVGKNGFCKIYEKRPQICREHLPGECERGILSDKEYTDIDRIFNDMKELHDYRDKYFPIRKKRKKSKK